MALLELPGLDLLTLPVSSELDFDAARAEEGRGPFRWVLLGAHLVPLHSPGLGKLVHVELELVVSSHGIVPLLAVVVPAEATQTAAQVRGSYHLHEAVPVPRDLQTCDGGEFEQVSVQVDVHPGPVVRQGDAGAVPPHSEVLVQTQHQASEAHLHRLCPGEGARPPGIVLHQHCETGVWTVDVVGDRSAPAVSRQNILTSPLEVKGPAIERVVVRVSKHGAHARLFSADRAAASPVQDLIRGAAADWNTLFGPTLDVSFDAGAEGAVRRRPHVALPVDLVAYAAVLDLLHFDVGQTLVAAVLALTRARFRAALPAHHRRVLAGAGGTVVVFKRGAVLIDFTVEQTAS